MIVQKFEFLQMARMKYPRGGWLYEPILSTLPVQTAQNKRCSNYQFTVSI